MSRWKKNSILVIAIGTLLFSLPLSANAQTAQGTLNRFNPNVNLNSGNSYGGVSISGVGGAIASCTNAGAFLANTASSLFSATKFGGAVKSAANFAGGGNAVEVSDKKAQDKLNSIDKTSKCLDGIAYAVAKNTLAQVTNKTLNWVNTGLNGNPLYVQNMDSYLRTLANRQFKTYLQTAQNSDPIFGNALESTIRKSLTQRSDGLLTVSLNTPQARAYNSFLGDFTNGGWSSLLNPANNPLGALFTATDNINRSVNTSQENAKAEVQRNNGFLDMKHCVQYATNNSTANTSQTISTGLSANATCLQWVTDTPGSIIAAQVQAITTSPIRQLEYADKINEVLGGFFDSFVNNLLAKGLRGSGNGTSSINFGFSSAGDNIVLDAGGNALNANGESLGYQTSTGGNAIGQNFDISRPQQFRAVLQAQYDYLNRAQDSQIALNRVVPTIGALDYCIPGPNPTWSSNVAGNWSTFVNSLQQASPNDPSTLEKIVSAIPVVGGFLDSIFGGSDEPPQIWSTPGILGDPVTGLSVQVPRTFYNSSTKFDGGITALTDGINNAYQVVTGQYKYYDYNTQINDAFLKAAEGDADASYIYGFLRESYTETSSLISYNQAASEIDSQYDTYIGQTQSNIDQMEAIRKQINAIVAQAKSDYIKKRAAAGNPVDMACINSAYQIDNSKIVPVARQENSSDSDPLVQHSKESADYFYSQIVQ